LIDFSIHTILLDQSFDNIDNYVKLCCHIRIVQELSSLDYLVQDLNENIPRRLTQVSATFAKQCLQAQEEEPSSSW
jgi:hypothetical protein